MRTYLGILAAAEKHGEAKLADGVYLVSRALIAEDMEIFGDSYVGGSFDYASAPFWVMTNSNNAPVPVNEAWDMNALDVNRCWLRS